MKCVVVAAVLAIPWFNAHAQVECTMPNGRTITLQLSHTCPAGAVGAKSLDGKPVQISVSPPPTPAVAPRAPAAPSAPASARSNTISQQSGTYSVRRAFAVGCSDEQSYDRLSALAAQKDMEAFAKALHISTVSGQCLTFDKGAVVFLEDTKIFSGMVRIRPKGNLRSYWTASENIAPN